MRQLLRQPWHSYGAALVASALALVLTQQIGFQDGSAYLIFLVAILLSARLGLGPGLLAGILAVLAIDYFVIPPTLSFWIENPNDLLRLATLALTAVVTSWLMAGYQKSRQLADLRAQHQSNLARLAELCLSANDPSDLFNQASALLCQALKVEYAAIGQLSADGTALLLQAGCGWREPIGEQVVLQKEPGEFSLLWNEPFVFDYSDQTRATRSRLLADHGITSGMGTIIPGDKQPFGVAAVFTSRPHQFHQTELDLLKTMAQMMAKAIPPLELTACIREKNNRLQGMLASMAEGVIAVDYEGRVTMINPVGAAITASSDTESVSKPVDDIFRIVDERTNQAIENPVSVAIRAGNIAKLATRAVLVNRAGERVPIDANAAPVRDESGTVVGAVLTFRDTSASRQIEDAIRQSEERLRVALKNSPVVVSNQDMALRYTWVHNPTRGFLDQSVLGKTDADLMPPSDAARWNETKRGVIEAGNGTRVEISATVEGQRRTFDLTVEPLRDQEGKIIGVTCALIDITERRREQAAVSRLAAIVESSEDAIIGKTLEGIILSWNPGAERLYGYELDEIIGQSAAKLYPPDRMAEFRETTERLKRGDLVKQHDTVRVRKDGKRIDVSVSVSLVRDGMGRIIGAASIARDITQRKRIETLQHFRAEVSEVLSSSRDYQATFEHMAQLAVPQMADWCAVYLLSEGGTLELVALAHVDPARVEQAHQLLRQSATGPIDVLGVQKVIRSSNPQFVPHVTDEDQSTAAHHAEYSDLLAALGLESYITVPLTARQQTFGAISFVSAESGRHFTNDDLAFLQDLANRAALLVENVRLFQELQRANDELEKRVAQRTLELENANKNLQAEIAERRRANGKLRQLSAHLQSAREEERTRVAREIHDELGQVLTVVKMDLGLLEGNLPDQVRKNSGDDLVAQIRATTQLVDDSIEKMRQIIRELRPGILDHLGLRSAIEWQAQEFQAHTGIECHLRASEEEIPLDLDRSTAVFRIFQETLTNIARHAQANRVDVELKKNDHLSLEVRDNGRGITESEISSDNSFGILGMRERALVFGGEVIVHGEPGRGTIVQVRIPLEQQDDQHSDRR